MTLTEDVTRSRSMNCRHLLQAFAITASLATSALAEPVPEPAVLTREELKNYFAIQQKLYPKKGDLFQQLLQTFGDHPTYTIYQVTAITDPKKKQPMIYSPEDFSRASQPRLVDAFSAEEASRQLSEYGKTHPEIKKQLTYTSPPTPSEPKGVTITVKSLYEALQKKYGRQPWYYARELRDVEENGIKPMEFAQRRLKGDPVRKALDAARRTKNASWSDFRSPRIRQNWRDVLYEDDPSQEQNASKQEKDLVGATFSYVNDINGGTETWSAIGAVILPWQHNFPNQVGLTPVKLAFAPSLSVNRVDTNGDPKNNVDSMLFRFGAYGEWMLLPDGTAAVQSRAAFVYATDTGCEASLPGDEIDIEPRWQNPTFPIGFKKILIPKAPLLEEESDQSLLEYQLRGWLHLEGGDVQDNGKSWDPTKGSFFRLGPTVQLQIRAPKLILGKDFSVTALYSYLAAQSGSEEHRSFFKVSGVLDLVKDDLLNHKISLTAEYQKGGLNFTKEDVDTLTLGLGVLY